MTRILPSLAALTLLTLTTTTHAQWRVSNDNGVLHIESGENGIERFRVRQNGNVALYADTDLDNDANDFRFIGWFPNVDAILFEGDDDRDEFENLTDLPSIQYGYGGLDMLIGGTNDDDLYGGEGYDYLDGDGVGNVDNGVGGSDWLDAGPDLEDGIMIGGPGNDVLVLNRYTVEMPGPFGTKVPTDKTFDQTARTIDLGGDPYDEVRWRKAIFSFGSGIYYPED